ncbi:hypothetical protein ACIHCQ_21480 [Streptomyces sp. NPDC052236]|uniref:hypothetical protein n=1 Tax=Streptomyces sp. NPDC052236 TaxID=3365686 RepID=UPI0037D530CC
MVGDLHEMIRSQVPGYEEEFSKSQPRPEPVTADIAEDERTELMRRLAEYQETPVELALRRDGETVITLAVSSENVIQSS